MGASGDSVSGGGETMTGWAPPVLWALAAAGGLRVETSTPDALCPDLGQVRAAAQARLGDVEGEGDWRASYGLIHRPDGAEAGDVVRLELRDPGGRLRLRRELPRAGESCAALARAIVVVLDAYFRHPTEPPVPATAAREPPPLSAATASVEPARSPPPLVARRRRRMVGRVGGRHARRAGAGARAAPGDRSAGLVGRRRGGGGAHGRHAELRRGEGNLAQLRAAWLRHARSAAPAPRRAARGPGAAAGARSGRRG